MLSLFLFRGVERTTAVLTLADTDAIVIPYAGPALSRLVHVVTRGRRQRRVRGEQAGAHLIASAAQIADCYRTNYVPSTAALNRRRRRSQHLSCLASWTYTTTLFPVSSHASGIALAKGATKETIRTPRENYARPTVLRPAVGGFIRVVGIFRLLPLCSILIFLSLHIFHFYFWRRTFLALD